MVKIFNRGWNRVTMSVDTIIDSESPVDKLPNVTGEQLGSIGDDINLPMLVRDVGSRKKKKLVSHRNDILKELEKIDKEMLQLDILLDAVEKL